MDPNLFHLDWDRTGEALVLIIILAFVIERALAVIFESKIWLTRFDRPGLKEIIAAIVSIWVCFRWQFDAVGMIILTEKTTPPGFILTGLVIAGGSKGSIKLFQDVLGMKSTALREHDAIRDVTAAASTVAAAAAVSPAAATESASTTLIVAPTRPPPPPPPPTSPSPASPH